MDVANICKDGLRNSHTFKYDIKKAIIGQIYDYLDLCLSCYEYTAFFLTNTKIIDHSTTILHAQGVYM
jgi:hypothetical protein